VSAFFASILLARIDVPANRLRRVKPWRTETIAKELAAGLPQQHPVNLVAEESGRFTLISGATRLDAAHLAGWETIDARVTPAAEITPEQRRMLEITENLNREKLTALEKAESLAELKRLHEALYPQTKKGGDRRSKASRQARADQSEIFSFRSEAAEMTGLSQRAIEIAVAIVAGLPDSIKARLRDTWLEDHQAGLKLLSAQPEETQHQVLDLLFSSPPEAATVADALTLVAGRRLLTAAEKRFASTLGNFARMSDRERADFFDTQETAILAHAKKRGWF
jgi:ParB family chromosome partitioning protein